MFGTLLYYKKTDYYTNLLLVLYTTYDIRHFGNSRIFYFLSLVTKVIVIYVRNSFLEH